jgi:dihydrofolate reductase
MPIVTSLIVARAENGVIGQDGRLPWHVPADLQHFKALTVGKPVNLGRKTFASIGRPLPGRTNIVVTRDPTWSHEGAQAAHDVPSALALAFEDALRSGVDEVMVIGGGEIYRQVMPQAQRIYLTEVHGIYDGDASFEFDRHLWREVSRADHGPSPGTDGPAYSFLTFERR